jgi:hypothetical protein
MLRGTTCLSGCVSATALIAAIVFPGAALAAPGGNGPDGTGAPGNPHAPGTTGNPHAPGTTGNPHQGEPPHGVANGHSKAQGNGNANAGSQTGGNGGGATPASNRGRGSGSRPTPAAGGGTPNGPPGKTTICHHTGSETNPYVEITVANPAVENGHSHHGDIVPAPSGGCEGSSPVVQSVNAAVNDAPSPASAPADGPVPLGASTSGPSGDSTSTLTGGGGAVLGPGEPVAGEPADPNASGGSLPFTGLTLGTLLSIALLLLFGGWLIRRLGPREETR